MDYVRQAPRDEKEKEGKMVLMLTADFQSAGKGQGKNHWESAPGENLLMAMRFRPPMVPVRSRFLLSEAHALALYDVLSEQAKGFAIKWPNDLYWKDRKIAGTLIECNIRDGVIHECIIGTGLNVNQINFRSDAPNPISLRQITGKKQPLKDLAYLIAKRTMYYMDLLAEGQYAQVVSAYHSHLYRWAGFHTYRDETGTFEASIVEVEDDGHLVLRDEENVIRSYLFQEVEYILPKPTPLPFDWTETTE